MVRLYAPVANRDPITRYNCNGDSNVKVTNDVVREEAKGSSSPTEKGFGASLFTPQSNCRVDAEEDDSDGDDLIDQERKILDIKDCLEDRERSDEDVVSLLQSLADMDITLKALREIDIGRHVNRLRKHSSNEVQILVKQLVRYMVCEGCIKPLCDLLICPDARIVTVCLEGLENILKVGEAEKSCIAGGVNLYAQMIDEAEGLDKIKNLQSHDNAEIHEKAVKILETYWLDDDNEDDGMVASDGTESGFHFGNQQQAPPFGGFKFG